MRTKNRNLPKRNLSQQGKDFKRTAKSKKGVEPIKNEFAQDTDGEDETLQNVKAEGYVGM